MDEQKSGDSGLGPPSYPAGRECTGRRRRRRSRSGASRRAAKFFRNLDHKIDHFLYIYERFAELHHSVGIAAAKSFLHRELTNLGNDLDFGYLAFSSVTELEECLVQHSLHPNKRPLFQLLREDYLLRRQAHELSHSDNHEWVKRASSVMDHDRNQESM